MNSRQVPIEILLSWLREVCCEPHCLFRTYKLFSRQRPPDFDLHQIYSVQIWCEKIQTKVKDKDGKYAFVLKFTAPCKLASKCGIKPSLFLIPP